MGLLDNLLRGPTGINPNAPDPQVAGYGRPRGLLGALDTVGGLLAYGPFLGRARELQDRQAQMWQQQQAEAEQMRQMREMQMGAMRDRQAQEQQDRQTGAEILGKFTGRAANNFQSLDPLMVQTTATRTPDREGAMALALANPGAVNPLMANLLTPPKRQDLPEGMMYDASGNPVPVPGYEQMRARIAAAGRAPAAPQFSSTILDNGNIGAFDTRTGRVIDTGQRATRPPSPQAQASADKQTAWNMYREARDGLIAGLSGSNTGPVAGRVPAITSAQQVAEGGVSAMAPVLKQLFRVAGEGTFTDRDQALLLEMVPTRRDNPAARDAKIANIDRIVRAKLGIPADTPTSPGGAAPADPLAGIASYMQKYGGR